MTAQKRCARCGQTKRLTAFYGNRSAPDGKQAICKACNTDDVRERYWRRTLKKRTEAELAEEMRRSCKRIAAIYDEVERRKADR